MSRAAADAATADTPTRAPMPNASEWASVRRVRVRVRQEYRYAYGSPATNLRQRLMMLPPERYGAQRLVASDLAVTGADDVEMRREADRYGNDVWQVRARRVPEAVTFTADFSVERAASDTALDAVHLPDGAPRAASLAAYLAPTALTAACDRIRDAAHAIAADVADVVADSSPPNESRLAAESRRQREAARRAGDWAAHAISYQYGITGVQTPAAMALHLGKGVCQDYAHLALAVMRQLHVAARYVSGHVLGEGAPHAWVEALLADPETPGRIRAVAYDPTHRRVPRIDYITVAVGRDYADIAPTSGTFSGTPGRFTARKDAWLEEWE